MIIPLLLWTAILAGQTNALQGKQVVYLQPHSGAIRVDFGGKQLDLLEAPAVIYLPMAPPKLDSQGKPRSIDIRNLGPNAVTVVGASQFSSRVIVGQTIHVNSNGRAYSLK
jgi:hypothetical protein